MWKFPLILALLPLAIAWAGQHWLWQRVKWQWLRQDTGRTQEELRVAMGLKVRNKKVHNLQDAANLGIALRDAGLELLDRDGDGVAKARRKGQWLLRVLPFLCGMVVLFGLVSHRFTPGWSVTAAALCMGLLVLLRLSGLQVELRGVTRGAEELRRARFFNRISDEDAVIAAARSSIWLSVWPW